jgi:hypothetical protein
MNREFGGTLCGECDWLEVTGRKENLKNGDKSKNKFIKEGWMYGHMG